MGRGVEHETETEDNCEELEDECGDESCDDWVLEEPVHVGVLAGEVVWLRG